MRSQVQIFIASVSLCTACSLLPNKDKTPQAAEKVGEPQARPQASIEAKQLAAEQEAEAVAEVVFPKGKAQLSAGEQARLAKITRRFGKDNKIERIVVAAWADKSLPGENAADLPKSAKDLAEARGQAVREYIEKNGGKDFDLDIHNMAEKPGVIAKFISSTDARVKKSLEGARPSKAIVLLIEKD